MVALGNWLETAFEEITIPPASRSRMLPTTALHGIYRQVPGSLRVADHTAAGPDKRYAVRDDLDRKSVV